MADEPESHDLEAINDPDNPELTDADFARARPFAEMFPEAFQSLKKQGGRPRLAHPKVNVSWRLSAEVVSHIQGTGTGYNSRVDDLLKDAIAKGLI